MSIQRAAKPVFDSAAQAALWAAVLAGDVAGTVQLLADRAARPLHLTQQRGTKCLLARALEHANPTLAELLLDAGADLFGPAHHTTCLGLVIRQEHWPLLRFAEPTLQAQPERLVSVVQGLAARQSLEGLKALEALGLDIQWANHLQATGYEGRRISALERWILAAPRSHRRRGMTGDPQRWREGLDFLGHRALDPVAQVGVVQALLQATLPWSWPAHARVAWLQTLPWWGERAAGACLGVLSADPTCDDLTDALLTEYPEAAYGPAPLPDSLQLTASPVGAMLKHVRCLQRANRPRVLQRALRRLDARLTRWRQAGWNPEVQREPGARQWLCLRAFVAMTLAGYATNASLMPILQVLQGHGLDLMAPLHIPAPSTPDTPATAAEHWHGKTLAEVFSWRGQLADLEQLAAKYPLVARAPGAWVSSVVPPSYTPGTQLQPRTLTPLLAFWEAQGADLAQVGTQGHCLLHWLGMATTIDMPVADLAAIATNFVRRFPALLEQRDAHGRTGLEAVSAGQPEGFAEHLQTVALEAQLPAGDRSPRRRL